MFWAFLLFLLAIMLAWCGYGQTAPPIPKLVAPPQTNRYYFAATAVDEYTLESDYSNEVSVPWTNPPVSVTLAWDPSPGTNRIVNYKIYEGDYPRWYTNTVNCGTNLTGVVVILPPPPRILVVTIGATNCPSVTWTNPTGNLLYRSRAWKVSTSKWPTVLEAKSLNPPSSWATLAGPLTNTSRPVVRLSVSTVLK